MRSFLSSRLRVAAPLGLVWFSFGSAYVATRIGVHGAPPLLFAGVRFVLAGLVLLAWCGWREGGLRLSRREALEGVAVGALTVLAGQGAVSLASTRLGAGVVAVLASTIPLWSALIGLAVFRARIAPLAWPGLVLGFAGVVMLASPSGAAIDARFGGVVLAGAAAWAAGTFVAARSRLGRRPLLLAAVQMTSGGLLQIAAGGARGEAAHVVPSALLPGAALAFAYLLVVGSLMGFPLFSWLATRTDPGIANSQAYVAPVVAMLLGWLVLGDAAGPRALAAAAISLAGVALIVTGQSRARRRVAAGAEQERELRDAA